LQLAANLDRDNAKLLTLVNKLKTTKISPGAAVEINDMLAWYWFGRYFSDKIKAGVALARYRYKGNDQRKEATTYLKKCSEHWRNYAATVGKFNKESFLFIIAGEFSLKGMQAQVDNDIILAMEPVTKK